ncbi:MAG: GNAT family N-acetyltransferase [Anaerolineae bacterium]|nr:GNAT family N-acetyltransferase [Anaerolineae bacterium]
MNPSPTFITNQPQVAVLDDIPALKKLIDQSVRHLGGQKYNARQIESSLTYIFGVDTQLIEDETYYVVKIDGQLAGAGGWSRRQTLYGGNQAKAGLEDNLLDPTHDPAKIRAFYVDPNFARRGIGRSLMQTCEDAARQAHFQRMELMATLPGQPLYAACGFQAIEPVDIVMPDGVSLPCVKMTKPLG